MIESLQSLSIKLKNDARWIDATCIFGTFLIILMELKRFFGFSRGKSLGGPEKKSARPRWMKVNQYTWIDYKTEHVDEKGSVVTKAIRSSITWTEVSKGMCCVRMFWLFLAYQCVWVERHGCGGAQRNTITENIPQNTCMGAVVWWC